jgi:thiol:disulfide interchange protein
MTFFLDTNPKQRDGASDHQQQGATNMTNYQHPIEAPRPGLGLAITGMTLGIIGVFLFMLASIFPILAIIFSSVSLNQTKKAQVKPQGMAVAGLVLGIVFTALGILYFVAVWAEYSS